MVRPRRHSVGQDVDWRLLLVAFLISTASFSSARFGLKGFEGADSIIILEQSVRPLGPTSSLGSASSTGAPVANTVSFLLSP